LQATAHIFHCTKLAGTKTLLNDAHACLANPVQLGIFRIASVPKLLSANNFQARRPAPRRPVCMGSKKVELKTLARVFRESM
jgi:hypothetical protein